MRHTQHQSKTQCGFTLVELLVALVIMALLALLSWRGLDGMTRVYSQTQSHTDGVLALQAGLAQWQTDLDAINEQNNVPGVSGLDYDGQVLRITRTYRESSSTNDVGNTGEDSIRVIAWSKRIDTIGNNSATHWLRWQSTPVKTRAELQAAWQNAKKWANDATEADKKGEVIVANIDQLQVFYYRKDAWTNALSSADATSTALPDGVRLVLTLSAGQALVGTITRDWVRPTLGGGK